MTDIASLFIQVLQLVWNWVFFLSPIKFTVIQQGSRGVRLSFGVNPKDLEPGLRCGTMFQTLHHERARYRTNVINSIRFLLSDGSPAKIDATIVYNVDSYGDYFLNAEDSGFMVSEFANAEIKRIISQYHADDLAGTHDALEAEITAAIQSKCNDAELGVSIRYSRLTDVEILHGALLTAMCLNTVVEKIADVLELEVHDAVGHRAFPSLVALVAGNLTNTTSINSEEPTLAEAEYSSSLNFHTTTAQTADVS